MRPGGTAILLHDLQRRFPPPLQTPYRALFADPATARDPDALREAERGGLTDERALEDYRTGRSVHPLEPFARLERVRACAEPARAGAGGRMPRCGLGPAARARPGRQLRRAPSTMARGRGAERIGFLLSPPYFPLVVGSEGSLVGEAADTVR